MTSELEQLVTYDMYENGFDPKIKEDVEKYWKERLPNDYTVHEEQLQFLHTRKDDAQ